MEPFEMEDYNLLQNDSEGTVYSSAAEPILYPADKWNIRPRLVEVGGSVQEYDPNPYRVLQMLYLIWNEDEKLLNCADRTNSHKRLLSYDFWVLPLESSAHSVDWEFRGLCYALFLQTFNNFHREIQELLVSHMDGLIEKVVFRKFVYIQRRLWQFRRLQKLPGPDSNLRISFSLYLRALKEIISGALNKLANFLFFPKGLKFIFKSSAEGQARLTSLFYLIHPKRVFHILVSKCRGPELEIFRKQITLINSNILRAALERPYYDRIRMVERNLANESLQKSANCDLNFEKMQQDLQEMALWEAERAKVYQDWTAKVYTSWKMSLDFGIGSSERAAVCKLVSAAANQGKQLAEMHHRRRSYALQAVASTNVELTAVLGSGKSSNMEKWITNHFGHSKRVRCEETLDQYNSRGDLTGADHSTLTLEQVQCLIYDPKIVQVLEDWFVDHWERLPGAAPGGARGGGYGIKIEKFEPEADVIWVSYKDEPISEESVYSGIRMCFDMKAGLMLAENPEKQKSTILQLKTEGKTDSEVADTISNQQDKCLFDATTTGQFSSASANMMRHPFLTLKRERGASVCIDRFNTKPDASVISSKVVGNPSCDEDSDISDTIRKKARTDDARNVKSGDTGCHALKLPSLLIPPNKMPLFGADGRVEFVSERIRKLIRRSDRRGSGLF